MQQIAFYEGAALLDRLIELSDPTPQQVDQVMSFLQEPAFFRYFFTRLIESRNPCWFKPLLNRGVFHTPDEPVETETGLYHIPTWLPSQYLMQVAGEYADEVVAIALAIKTENFRVHQDLIRAAMNMPPNIAAQMVPAVAKWVGGRFESSVPEYAGDLMVYLADGDRWGAALDLLELLTEPVVGQLPEADDEAIRLSQPSEARPRFDKYLFKQFLKGRVSQLARQRSFEILEVIERQLTKAIEYEEGAGLRKRGTDDSIFWRAAIEDHPQNGSIRGFKELLTEAIRELLEEVAAEEQTRSILERYLEHRYSIFRRLTIHIVRLHPEHYRDLLVQLFSDRDNLSDPNIHHEFYLLMESTFDKVPPEVQQQVLEWIVEGQPPERLESSKSRYRQDHGGAEPPEDLVRQWQQRWTLRRMWALRNHDLPPEYRSKLDTLVAELGEPEHPSFLVYSTVSWTGAVGPMGKEEMLAMAPEEVLEYLKQYVPPQDPLAPSLEGLLNVFRTVVQERAEEYAALAPRFLKSDVRPVYMYHLLWGLEEAVKAGKSFDWSPVLTFCEEVVQRTDEESEEQPRPSFETSYAAAHGQIASLLQEAARRDDHVVPMEHMPRVRDILLKLVRHPDPTPEYEQTQLAHMDPATNSLNTVRGKAMHALIVYVLRRARLLEVQTQQVEEEAALVQHLEPEVKEALAEKLDKAQDPSPAVHSVFGLYLHNLYYLDQEWITLHLSQIFPTEADKQVYWWAAWNSYIAFNPLYNDLYRLLRNEYRRAMEQLPEGAEDRAGFERAGEHLAGHLMIAYWRGLEELEGDDSLLALFYERAPDEVRAHAIWSLWRGLEQVKPSAGSEIWPRLRRLWEARVNAATQAEDPAAFSKELSAFAWWLNVVPESLDSLYPLIETIVPHLERGAHTSQVIDYLAEQATDYPGPAACLLLEIIQQEEQPLYRGEETRAVLEAAMRSGDEEARSCAERAINLLGERGRYEYRDLLELKPGT